MVVVVVHPLVVVAVLARPRDALLLVEDRPPDGLVAGAPLRRGFHHLEINSLNCEKYFYLRHIRQVNKRIFILHLIYPC